MSEDNNEYPLEVYRFHSGGRELENEEPTAPKSLNEEKRSVDIIIASDKPVNEYDFKHDRMIPTVILPEGIQVPKNGQVPHLDCHSRGTTDNMIGSIRNMRVEGNEFVGTAFYADDKKSDRVFKLVKGGHLTDYSIGADKARGIVYLKAGETKEFHGRSYEGPMKIIQKINIREVSSCPIGADDTAKNRSKQKEEPTKMAEDINRTEPQIQPDIDIEKVKRDAAEEAQKLERARMSEIDSLCRSLDMDNDFREEVKNLSVDEAKDRAIQVIAKRNEEVNLNSVNRINDGEGDKLTRALEDGLMLRSGLLGDVSAERSAAANDYIGYSLVEICREACRLEGHNHRGHQYDVISRAMSTSSFPNVLGNIARKQLLESFEKADETYKAWCDTSGNLKDFHIHSKVRAGELGNLREQVEGEAVRYSTRTEQKETVQLATYSDGYKLTRKAIINDELGELTDAFQEFGEAVQRLYGDMAYDILTLNAAMGDGDTLFHANHGNLGTQGIVSETTIGEAIKLMKLQKDIGNLKRLHIRPQFLLSAVKNEAAVERFFTSEFYNDGNRQNNIYQNRFQRIYDPRLDDYDSGDPWFLLGAKGKTVKLFFLNGKKQPFFEREKDFDTDTIKWKVRTDVGSMAVRWEGMVKNTGA